MMHIALEAFPQVPWIFVYRQPVETMMSHVGPGKGKGAPCLRSKKKPPAEVWRATTLRRRILLMTTTAPTITTTIITTQR